MSVILGKKYDAAPPPLQSQAQVPASTLADAKAAANAIRQQQEAFDRAKISIGNGSSILPVAPKPWTAPPPVPPTTLPPAVAVQAKSLPAVVKQAAEKVKDGYTGSTGDLNIAPQGYWPGSAGPDMPAETAPCSCQDSHCSPVKLILGGIAAVIIGAIAGYSAGALAR